MIAVVDATAGQTAIYQYDAVGNLLGIVRQPATTVSILNFTPKSGPVGTTVTPVGTGYSATASQNTVRFNGTIATITSATTTQLIVTVPASATTGAISVTTPTGSANSSTSFTVTTGGALGAPTITSFTPTIGASGTSVSITGTNFDPTPGNTKVRFNGPLALPTTVTATTTSVTASVPSGAISGPIMVGTPLGTATSASDFFVPPSPYTAADVELYSRIAFGETKTIAITTANRIGFMIFDGTVNQKISLVVNSSTFPGSRGAHTLKIISPDGTTLDTIGFCIGDTIGAVSLPATGTYTILIDPYSTNTGQASVTLYSFVDVTGPIAFGGPALTANLTTPGQTARWTFTAVANQKVSVVLNSTTVTGTCGNHTLALLNSNGNTVTSWTLCAGTILGPVTLSAAGTYTVLADPYTNSTGSVTVTLHNVVDVTGTITTGSSASATVNTPGQRALWTFTGTANQQVSIVVNSSTIGSCVNGSLSVLKPDGTTLSLPSGGVQPCAGSIWGPQILPVSGTYTIVADPYTTHTGAITIALYNVVDVTGSISFGSSASATMTTPGQRALWTFTGTANQQVSIVVNSSTIGSCINGSLKVLKPDGTTLTLPSGGVQPCAGSIWGPQTLPVSGTYTIVADPYTTYTGAITITLHNVVDVTGTATFGSAVNATLTTPGQRALWTFTGTVNQRVSIVVNSSTIGSCINGSLRVLKPDGTTLTLPSGGVQPCAGSMWGPQTLPVSGTYTIVVDPYTTFTGAITLTPYNVVDVTGSLTIGGAALAVTLTTPGQIANLTFAGTASQLLTVRVTGNTISNLVVRLLRPDSTTLTSTTSSAASFNLTQQTLPTTGTYTVQVDPPGTSTGNLNVSVTSP